MKKIGLFIACVFFVPLQSMQSSKSSLAAEKYASSVLRLQEIANPVYNNAQELFKAEAQAREDQWCIWKGQAPRALQAEPAEALAFFKQLTDDVATWGSLPATDEIDYAAQRLLCMALFCQTKDALKTTYEEKSSLWRLLDTVKKQIEAMNGGALTGQDRAIIYQLCRDGTVGAHHDDEPCMGKATICKNCKRLISVLACLSAIGNCCKETAFPVRMNEEYEGCACHACTEKLRHKLLLRLKSLVVGFHQFQLPLKASEDIELVKWAILYKK